MKTKALFVYAGLMTVAVIVLSVMLAVSNGQGDKEDIIELKNTIDPIQFETLSPTPFVARTPTPTPALSTPTPIPYQYIPNDEETAFMNGIIAEGKTIILEISEWDMINILCNKLGFDEYKYRLIQSKNEAGEDCYYLTRSREVYPAANYIAYGLDPKTGNLFIEEDGVIDKGNIFTRENMKEPERLPKGDEFIELFIEKILGELPEGTELELSISQMGDWHVIHSRTVDGTYEEIAFYYINECTGEVFDVYTEEYIGSLVD